MVSDPHKNAVACFGRDEAHRVSPRCSAFSDQSLQRHPTHRPDRYPSTQSTGVCVRRQQEEAYTQHHGTVNKETFADMDRETVVSSLFDSVSRRKSDRDQNVAQTLRDRQNLHKILERKAELAMRGEKLAQQRLYQAEADVEVKHWEKRNPDIALFEMKQEYESQRLQLQQANQWADQSQKRQK